MDVDGGDAPGTTAANYKAINAPQTSFKPLAQVTSHTEAAAYAANGYQVAYKNKWYAAAELYFNAFAAARAQLTRYPLSSIKDMLRRANSAADKARAAVSPIPIKPSNDVELPEHMKSAGFMGGMPWWALVGAGAAVYFMVKKGKKSPSRRKSAPRRKRPSRSSKRPRSLQRRRRRGY